MDAPDGALLPPARDAASDTSAPDVDPAVVEIEFLRVATPACATELTGLGATGAGGDFEPEIVNPVYLTGFASAVQPYYAASSGATVHRLKTSCAVATRLARAVRTVRLAHPELTGILDLGSYYVRDVRSAPGTPSSHATASAVDIVGVRVGSAERRYATAASDPLLVALRSALRAEFACSLGPDNDPSGHADHVHADVNPACNGAAGSACPADVYAIATCTPSGTAWRRCVSGTVEQTPCEMGCLSNPIGTPDRCLAIGDACTSTPIWTCNTTRSARVRCRAGRLERESCAGGCVVHPVGTDDTCATAGSAPSAPVLASPASGAAVSSGVAVRFVWSAVSGARRYRFARCPTATLSGTCDVREVPTVGVTQIDVGGLPAGRWWWSASAIGADESLGWGPYAAARELVVCGAGQIACDGVCVDPTSDRDHCGDCATRCAVGEFCSARRCAATCTPTTEVCDGRDNNCNGMIDDGASATCSTPPAASCASSTTLRSWSPAGTCASGACSYASADRVCPFGCAAGACIADPCAGVACATPPAASCVDGSTFRTWSSSGTCASGACVYASSDRACPGGCVGGGCREDPCAGLSCTTPPSPDCTDASTLRTWSASGVCAGGTCTYTPSLTSCPSGCAAGACRRDLCAGVVCMSPPAADCTDATTLRTWSSSGTCSAGACVYAPSTRACAYGCSAGACRMDPCAGLSCSTPPPPACTTGTTLRTWSSVGTCSAGACVYAFADRMCAGGCSAGACVAMSPNLLVNGSFEDASDSLDPPAWAGWVGWQDASRTDMGRCVRIEASDAPDGRAFVRCTVTGATGPGWAFLLDQASWPLTSGTAYELAFWVRANAPRTLITTVQENLSGTSLGLTDRRVVGTVWTEVRVPFTGCCTATGGTDFDAKLAFWLNLGAGTIDFDNVRITAR